MYFDVTNGMYVPDVNSGLISINDFAAELIAERDKLGRPTVGKFNTIVVMARFGDTVEDIVADFKKQIDGQKTISNSELKHNGEHYVDPTAYKAIKKADRDAEYEKVRKLTGCLRRVCELSGFSIIGRIELLDETTGKVWK